MPCTPCAVLVSVGVTPVLSMLPVYSCGNPGLTSGSNWAAVLQRKRADGLDCADIRTPLSVQRQSGQNARTSKTVLHRPNTFLGRNTHELLCRSSMHADGRFGVSALLHPSVHITLPECAQPCTENARRPAFL